MQEIIIVGLNLAKGFALEIPARSLFSSIHEIINAQGFEKPEAIQPEYTLLFLNYSDI
jgi:hypothetical protein